MRNAPAIIALGSSVGNVCWNPVDKSSNLTLSGSNKTATRAAGTSGYAAARATTGKDYTASGYFEVAITAMDSGGYIIVGIGTSSAGLNTNVGADSYGWGYYGAEGGKKVHGGTATAFGSAYAQGDVIGIAFNNGKIWFSKNNTWYGDPGAGTGEAFSGITGTLFPMISLYDATAPVDSVTGRFKSADFSYSPPSGFSAWESS